MSDGLGLKEEGAAITAAIERTLASGLRTKDIAAAGDTPIGTAAMADAIAGQIELHRGQPEPRSAIPP